MPIRETKRVDITCDNCHRDIVVPDKFHDLREYGFVFCHDCMTELTAIELFYGYLHQGERHKFEKIAVAYSDDPEGYMRLSDFKNSYDDKLV